MLPKQEHEKKNLSGIISKKTKYMKIAFPSILLPYPLSPFLSFSFISSFLSFTTKNAELTNFSNIYIKRGARCVFCADNSLLKEFK